MIAESVSGVKHTAQQRPDQRKKLIYLLSV